MPGQGHAKRRATQPADQPVKRKRVSRACDQCRLAREKCDGNQPTCSTCIRSQRGCTYTATVKKRGIQPGYIRALELALAFLFQHNSENDSLVNDELSQGGPGSLLLSRDSKASKKLHKRWRKARFQTNLEQFLSGGEPAGTDLLESFSSDSDDDVSEADVPVTAGITGQHLSEGREGLFESTKPTGGIPEPSQQSATSGKGVPLPSDHWRLIETYFTNTHSWIPICEKHDVLKLSYTYPAEGIASPFDVSGSGSYAELWSILAVALLYGPDGSGTSTQPAMSSKHLYATTRSFIPNEFGHFDLGHVRALLNLAVFNMAGSLTTAWLLVGCAARIAQALEPQSNGGETRRMHTFRGCVMLESLLAVHFGRRPCFEVDDLRRFAKVDENGLEEWQPWVCDASSSSLQQPRMPLLALSSFNALTDIAAILANAKHASADKRLQQFNRWKEFLPSKLGYITSEITATPLSPPAVLLQLVYYCTALTVTSSRAWVLRSMVLLERVRDQMDLRSRSPALRCLMDMICNNIAQSVVESIVDPTLQCRSMRILADINEAWASTSNNFKLNTEDLLTTQLVQPPDMPTTSSMTHNLERPTITGSMQELLPPFDLHDPIAQSITSHNEPGTSTYEFHVAVPMDTRYLEVPADFENMFDELASFDQPNTADSQPQFMQNLGFTSDTTLASMFGEDEPQSTINTSQNDSPTLDLSQYDFSDIF